MASYLKKTYKKTWFIFKEMASF